VSSSSSREVEQRHSQDRSEVEAEEGEGAIVIRGEDGEGKNDELAEWVTIYIGSNTIVGDSSTLRRTRVQKEYRVAAGNGLGWSDWSQVLPVIGELAAISSRSSGGDGGVLSSVDAPKEMEPSLDELRPIFSEVLLVQTVDDAGTRRLRVIATPTESGKLALNASIESFPNHHQQEALYLCSEDFVTKGSEPAWIPNATVQTSSKGAEDTEAATSQALIVRSTRGSSFSEGKGGFDLTQFRSVLEQRLRVDASGALTWAPSSPMDYDDAPNVLTRIEYVDAAPLHLVLSLMPGRRREEGESGELESAKEETASPSRSKEASCRKLLVKILSRANGDIALETTDFINDRNQTYSFKSEELSAVGLDLKSSSEGLSEENAMLLLNRLTFTAGGVIILLPRQSSKESSPLESKSKSKIKPAADSGSGAVSSPIVMWPFSAVESTPTIIETRDTALESRVIAEASRWVPVSDEVLQHVTNGFFTAPRLAPPYHSKFMSMLAEITATEAKNLAALRGLVRPPSRFLNTVQGPIYSRPPSQSPKNVRNSDWALQTTRNDDKPVSGVVTRPKSVSKKALRLSDKNVFTLKSTGGSVGSRSGSGSNDVNDMQLLLLGNQSASKVYAFSSSSSRPTSSSRPGSSHTARLRTPKLPPLNYQPHKWGPTTPPRHRTHRMPPFAAKLPGASSSDRNPEVQEELERDELGLLWRT
jgi:hypothetical protein